MKLDGYVRVSWVGGRSGPSFISPELQREQIEAWARFKGAELLEIHVDLDEKGGSLKRPGLDLALERAETGVTDGIVVAKLDRFARSLIGALETIRRLDEAGAALISVAEGIDPTTAAGKAMIRMLLVMAEFELDRLRESWTQARRKAIMRGIHVTGVIPTGYRRGGDGRLTPDGRNAELMAECIRMRAAAYTWREITEFANASGLRSNCGRESWDHSALWGMMRNRVYIGEARSGKFVLRQAHEAIVERGMWEAAQAVRTMTESKRGRPTLLAGLLRCAECRRILSPGVIPLKGGTINRYFCKREAPGGCARPAMERGPEIEQFVEDRFFEMYAESPICRSARPETRENATFDLIDAEENLEALHGDSWAPEQPEPSDLEEAEAEVEGARRRAITLARSTLLPSPSRLRLMWPHLSASERRRYISHVIGTAFIRRAGDARLDQRVAVVPYGRLDVVELPTRGSKRPVKPFVLPSRDRKGSSSSARGTGNRRVSSLSGSA